MNLFICFFFFFNDTATTEIYTLSLHDALPISTGPGGMPKGESNKFVYDTSAETGKPLTTHQFYDGKRSEEHTSELQSQSISYAVFCLKKKKRRTRRRQHDSVCAR